MSVCREGVKRLAGRDEIPKTGKQEGGKKGEIKLSLRASQLSGGCVGGGAEVALELSSVFVCQRHAPGAPPFNKIKKFFGVSFVLCHY